MIYFNMALAKWVYFKCIFRSLLSLLEGKDKQGLIIDTPHCAESELLNLSLGGIFVTKRVGHRQSYCHNWKEQLSSETHHFLWCFYNYGDRKLPRKEVHGLLTLYTCSLSQFYSCLGTKLREVTRIFTLLVYYCICK